MCCSATAAYEAEQTEHDDLLCLAAPFALLQGLLCCCKGVVVKSFCVVVAQEAAQGGNGERYTILSITQQGIALVLPEAPLGPLQIVLCCCKVLQRHCSDMLVCD